MQTWTLGVGLNVGLSLALIGALTWAIVSPRFADGVVIKLGLMLLVLGMVGTVAQVLDGLTCSDTTLLMHSRTLMLAGIALVVVGVAWRAKQGQRRASDLFGVPSGNRRREAQQ